MAMLAVYSNQSRSPRIEPQPTSAPMTTQVAVINRFSFEPLGEADANLEIAKRFKVVLHTKLSKHEYTQLMQSFSALLTVFYKHDFPAFKQAVIERHGTPSAVWSAGVASLGIFHEPDHLPGSAKSLFNLSQPWPPKDNWITIQAWWAARYDQGGVWKGVQMADAQIEILEQTGEPSRADQDAFAAKVAKDAPIRLFQDNHFFAPEQGKAKYAVVYFVAEHQGGDPIFPLFLWFRWDKAVDNWILDKAAQSYSADRSSHCDLIL